MKEIKDIAEFLNKKFHKEFNEVLTSLESLSNALEKSRNNITKLINNYTLNHQYDKVRNHAAKADELTRAIKVIDNMVDEISVTRKKHKNNIEKQQHGFDEDYTKKKPYAYVWNGKEKKVESWAEMFMDTCKMLIDKNPDKFIEFVGNKDLRNTFSKEDDKMKKTKKIKCKNQDIFVIGYMTANDNVSMIKNMLIKYGLNLNDFIIYLDD